MSARDFEDEDLMQLSERRIERGSEWIGKKVFQYSPDSNELIVLIKRGNRAIIPRGNTVIHKNDVMVINKLRRKSPPSGTPAAAGSSTGGSSGK